MREGANCACTILEAIFEKAIKYLAIHLKELLNLSSCVSRLVPLKATMQTSESATLIARNQPLLQQAQAQSKANLARIRPVCFRNDAGSAQMSEQEPPPPPKQECNPKLFQQRPSAWNHITSCFCLKWFSELSCMCMCAWQLASPSQTLAHQEDIKIAWSLWRQGETMCPDQSPIQKVSKLQSKRLSLVDAPHATKTFFRTGSSCPQAVRSGLRI